MRTKLVPVVPPRSANIGVMLAVCLLVSPVGLAQHPGDCVRLSATHVDGVPIHAESRNSFTGRRFPDGTIAQVVETAHDDRWLRVQSREDSGWISSRYAAAVVACPTAPPPPTLESIGIATWNLEYLKEGAKRGFPEFQGANALPPRTDADYQFIADTINTLDLSIVLLQEINGHDVPDESDSGSAEARSHELDRLVSKLGADRYAYVIGTTGGAQRLAVLYDTQVAHLVWHCEAALPNTVVEGSKLFARQPLLAYFRLFDNGVEMNDFVVISLHLASKRELTQNHDQAMTAVVAWVEESRAANGCVPAGEFDVLLAGDLNADRFDSHMETFWDNLEATGWDVLADHPSYPATRLTSNPPAQHDRKLDYVIVSQGDGGLAGEEITQTTATVHAELVAAAGGGMSFRSRASDHLPVSVRVRVIEDSD